MKLIQCEIPKRYDDRAHWRAEIKVNYDAKEWDSEYEFTQPMIDRIDACFYWYIDEGYEGSGRAVVFWKDGTVDIYDLGHCSCYGLLDSIVYKSSGAYNYLEDIIMSDEEREICYTVLLPARQYEKEKDEDNRA